MYHSTCNKFSKQYANYIIMIITFMFLIADI